MGFARRKALQWNLGSMLHGQQLIATRGRACHDCATRWGIWWVEDHLGRFGNKTFPFYQPGSLWRGFNTEGSLVGGYGRRLCEVSTNHCLQQWEQCSEVGFESELVLIPFSLQASPNIRTPRHGPRGERERCDKKIQIKTAEIRR